MIKTKSNATCFVLPSSITDHEAVALNIDLNQRPKYNQSSFHCIDYEGLDIAMKKLNLQSILDCTDVNVATNLLVDYITISIKNNSKTAKTSNKKRISKPWVTPQLLRCMKNRDNLYKKVKKDPNNTILKTTYKRYRNFCTNLLRKAKRNYDSQELQNNKNNKKKLWETIKNISGTNRKADYSCNLITSHNPIRDLNTINTYFATVGKKLAERIEHNQTNRYANLDYLTPLNSLVLLPTTEEEVLNVICKFRDKCAVGLDRISGTIIKRYASLLSSPIAYITNLAFSTGIFPHAFKTALIKPIYKSGDKDSVSNFRPISILPTMSKIVERLMNVRLVDFLEKNNLLSPSQFGFRRGKSTNDAVHEFVTPMLLPPWIKERSA